MDDKELKAAEEEGTEGLFTYELKKPVEYNGEKVETLSFDFEGLTGQDQLDIDSELRRLGKPSVVPALDDEFLIRMAAKACTQMIGSDIFPIMSMADFGKIISQARSFLLRSE